ncbi:FKBP-type peptidyl-prolyl cis-trans isomerase [candidate division KSB1 bacterium]
MQKIISSLILILFITVSCGGSKETAKLNTGAVTYETPNAKFLRENAAKEGVVTLPSGLQYKILREGTGPSPGLDDKVVVHYKGELINGTEFENSYKRGKANEFKVSGVIPGWTEALQLMKVGAKWQIVIPPDIGYGLRTSGPIPMNSILIFETELLQIVK